MEQYGNTTTYNIETVLVQNIRRSQYWEKRAGHIADWSELVDEIYEAVDNVEPWMSGNARGPSTAFNLLYRLAQLKPDPEHIRMMLDHRDSPYIRAVGFLYLRYVCNPRDLWGWCKDYLYDEEEFDPSPQGLGHTITLGEFVRDIMLDQFYFETIFPRVPKTVSDEIRAHLKEMGLPTEAKGNAGQGGADRRGAGEGNARPASVKASLSVAFGQRAPNRAGTREQGRGMGAELQVGKDGGSKRSPSPYKQQRGGERHSSRDDRRRGDGRKDRQGGDRRGPDRHDRRDRDDRQQRSRSRSRDRPQRRERSRSRERYQRDYARRDGGGGGGGRRDNRDYDRRDYDRRDYDRRDDRRDDRRRSRSRERQRSISRDARDVFRERAAPVHADVHKMRETYG